MEFKTIPVNFSFSVTLKSIGLFWNRFLAQEFVTSYVDHLALTGSLSYTDLPNVDTVHFK